MHPDYLIGKKFKRNKYGMSSWTDTISEVEVHFDAKSLEDGSWVFEPKVYVRGMASTGIVYPLSEIVLVDMDDTRVWHNHELQVGLKSYPPKSREWIVEKLKKIREGE